MKKPQLTIKNHAPFSIDSIGGKNAEETQVKGCRALDGHKYWITSGNLLGIYRDKKLIDYDTDIDVGLLVENNVENLLKKIESIVLSLVQEGFYLIRTVVYKDQPMQIAFMDGDNDVIFDIYLFYEDGDVAYNYNPEGYILKPMKFIEELGEIEFEGDKFPIPGNIEEYLVWRFGENWKTPTGKKVPWQTEATHLQKWL